MNISKVHKVFNSVFAGWPLGLFIDGTKCQDNAEAGTLVVKNCILAGMKDNFKSEFEETYFNRAGGNNQIKTINELNITNLSLTNPSFLPKSGSALLSGADFAGLDSYFERVNFQGAFGSEDWTAGWCNFDPQNTDYK